MSIIGCDENDFARASAQLQGGGLVSFPTETVYGLGANALDESAAKRIFEVKGRPASDPLIVHILNKSDSRKLTKCSDEQQHIFDTLADNFWPGPLTLVAPAADCIPSVITAATGWVGVRSPKHATARKLLEHSKIYIAAPSANRFNHVSPTAAEHVLEDLGKRDEGMLIISGDPCNIGVESSVVKVHTNSIEVLRRGGVTTFDLQKFCAASLPHITVTERDTKSCPKKISEAMEGPGQTLTHYSPSIPSYLWSDDSSSSSSEGDLVVKIDDETIPLREVVVIDFGKKLRHLERKCLGYRDLSEGSDAAEAAQLLFEVLRWTETVEGAKIALLPPLPSHATDLSGAVEDRLFRAASGKTATICS